MKPMNRLALITLALPLAAACSTARTPLWTPPEHPAPLPPLNLSPGESAELAVAYSAPAPGARLDTARLHSPPGIMLRNQPNGLLAVSPQEELNGIFPIQIPYKLPQGETAAATLLLNVEPKPVVEFAYTPPAGQSPATVSLAGDFNGWSATANPFTRGTDGTFTLSKRIDPGTYSYKLVVDGDWIADPANPEQDSSGYGNSILRVEGTAVRPLSWAYTGRRPGDPLSSRGTAVALLEPGETLQPDSVVVLLNNQKLPPGAYSVNTQTGEIALNTASAGWTPESYVLLSASTTDGRRGMRGFWLIDEDAPRSPRDEIIYFPMTDRFHDGDPSLNDPATDPRVAPLANYMGGDWAGIRQKIEEGYFTDLGVTSLWISPVYQNIQEPQQETPEPRDWYTSYHSYWPVSSTETNTQFGSMADLRAMVDAAHQAGITILLDFVANHVHEEHPLYQANPTIGTPYQLPDGRTNLRLFDEHPMTTWFDSFLPSLDYENNAEITDYMVENAVYWIRETGADGFRHDAVKHIPTPFWRTLTTTLHETFPDRQIYQVGETISGYSTVAEYVSPDLLTGQFDFPAYFTLRNVLASGRGSMADLAETLENGERYYHPAAVMSPLVGNHDVSRFMAFADSDLPEGMDEKEVGRTQPPVVDDPANYRKLLAALAFVMTTPGAPMLYYGDEIGMTGAGDPDNRRPMIWEGLSAEQEQLRQQVSQLLNLRLDTPALRGGTVQVLDRGDEHLAFARITPEQTVLVFLFRNPAEKAYRLALPGWMQPQQRQWATLHAVGVEGTQVNDSVQLTVHSQGYSYLVGRLH